MRKFSETTGDKEFPLTPSGSHIARCYITADIGRHTKTYPDGPKTTNQIVLTFELGKKLMEDGRPFAISENYNYSSHPKANFMKHLVSWRGVAFSQEKLDSFHIFDLLGKYCMLTVVHSEDGKWANIAGISPVPEDTELPEPVNDSVGVDLDSFKQEDYDRLPNWIKKKIDEREEEPVDDISYTEDPSTKAGGPAF